MFCKLGLTKVVLNMLKYFLNFLCILVTINSIGQNCDLQSALKKIINLNAVGNFDSGLDSINNLLLCSNLTNDEKISLYTWKYKLQRNKLKRKDAHESMLLALDQFNKSNQNGTIEFNLLLAESYAAVKDSVNFNTLIPKIEEEVLKPENSNNTLLGQYYITKYFMLKKGSNPDLVIEYLQKALAVIDRNATYYKGQILRGLGNMNRRKGDFDNALSYYKRELDLYSPVYPSNHFDIAVTHYNVGGIYYEKLNYELALEHFLQAHEVWVNVYEPDNSYMRYLNEAIGDMYWELDQKENALTYFELATTNETLLDNDISKSYITLGDSLLQKGNHKEAIKYYKDAVQWRENTFGKNHVLTGACQNFVARALKSSGKIEAALDSYQEAIDIMVDEMESSSWYDNPSISMKIQSHFYLLESLSSKSDLLLMLYEEKKEMKDLKTAFETQEVAIDVLEDMTNKQMSESSRIFWTDHIRTIIEKSIVTAKLLYGITKDDSFLKKSFSFTEKNKALLLLAAIQDQNLKSFANIPTEILNEEHAFKTEIANLKGKIATEENRCAQVRDKILQLWKNKLNDKQNNYDIFLLKLSKDYPDYFSLKYDLNIAQYEDIQNYLKQDDAVILSYFTGMTSTFVFRLAQQEISLRQIDNASDLSNDVRTYINLINSQKKFNIDPKNAFVNYSSLAYKIYKTLLEVELSKSESINKLVIIPDGILAYLPFGSLLENSTKTGSRNYKDLPYLFKSYAISYSPSVSIKLLSEQSTKNQHDYIGFAPDYANQNYSETREKMAKLDHNKNEIETASKLFNGKFYTGDKVTEDLIKTSVSKAGIVHLAMHGQVEDEKPLLSRLYFNSSSTNDGLLHTYEIYNLKIPAQLVILSACNTATGKLVKGEGILSLERAFQFAGSQSLLSTLWTVDDASSSNLTQLFLTNLKSGQPKDVALQQAKIQYLNSAPPERLTPYYLSSFKLTGNTKSLDESTNYLNLLISLGILAALLGYFIKQKTKSKAA